MTYEFSRLSTEGGKAYVIFNKAGEKPLKVPVPDFALSQHEGQDAISSRSRLDAVVAIIDAGMDVLPPKMG